MEAIVLLKKENSYKSGNSSYIKMKQERREKKRADKRSVSPDEVIYIFEKILEGWKTIRIYNTIIQGNPDSQITKKKVETISTGNCRIFPKECNTPENYQLYLELRQRVYDMKKKEKDEKV